MAGASPSQQRNRAGRRRGSRFVDSVRIHVRAGHGGRGAATFRREPFIPHGGPDGGDGGRGGSVIVVADPSLSSLETFAQRHAWSAEDGAAGAGSRKEGRSGHDVELKVPVGTVIVDEATGEVLADLATAGALAIVAHGGAGGRGNIHFATPARRAPRFSEPGQRGEERELRLDLKLIADVGIVGLPNAGKSSLLRAVSAAQPAVGDYPFTTLEPTLGVAERANGARLVFADIPGLIEGASSGAGLGLTFLRHVERTRVLLYLLDGSVEEPWRDLETVRGEVRAYSPELAARPSVTAVNKLDLPSTQELRRRTRRRDLVFVSALTGDGISELLERVAEAAATAPAPASQAPERTVRLRPRRPRDVVVQKRPWGFEVDGETAERLLERVDLSSAESLAYFQRQLDRLGISAALENAGVEPGDTVRISGVEFEYQPG